MLHFFPRIYVLLISLFLIAATPETPAEWKGEYFDKAQGGAFLRTKLMGFKASEQTHFLMTPIKISITNVLSGKVYVLTHQPTQLASGARQIWKLPAGKYAVDTVGMVDASGVSRTWQKDKKGGRLVIIRRQCLSNLGLWSLSPRGDTGLALQFAMMPHDYNEDGPKRESSIAAVLDGFSGLVQEAFAGKRILEAATKNYATDKTMRQTISFTRQVGMFFRLNLFKHNRHGQDVARILNTNDGQVRQCYLDALEESDALKGDLQFTFLLSKKTGTMSKLRHTDGAIKDAKMIRCVYLALGQMQFPVPENMIGEITYTFHTQ